MMGSGFSVPAAPGEARTEVKKSRFIARAERVGDREHAMEFLARVRALDPDARHHCWAYLIGNPSAASCAAMNDDGEPSGTAGKPILNVIQHKDIGDVMVVVSRYFGGVKLGAGGLTRAYSGAAEAVLAALPLRRDEPMAQWELVLDFAMEQSLRHWAVCHDAQVVAVTYATRVTVSLAFPQRYATTLEAACAAQGIHIGSRDLAPA